jgi:hypothetical protein
MAIKHSFVSSKTEQSDPTLVGPNEWNNNHVIDSEIVLPDVAAPATPAVGNSALAPHAVSGRDMFGCQPGRGSLYTFQPHVGRKRVREIRPRSNATTLDRLGMDATVAAGTLTGRNMVTTNMFTAAHRVGHVSGAGAGNQAQLGDNTANHAWLGNAARLGGFHYVIRFGVSDASLVATANMFLGLAATVYASDTAPQTLANILGIGCTSGDTALQIYGAGAAAQARTSLGASFPCNTISTDWYEFAMFAPQNANSVYYQVTRLNTGDVATGTLTGAQIPANTQLLQFQTIRSNGGTAVAVAYDFGGVYIETDN